jgi:hypothetical protein
MSPLVERKKRQYNLLWGELRQPEFTKKLSEVQCDANVWKVSELLLFRVPPWRQQVAV